MVFVVVVVVVDRLIVVAEQVCVVGVRRWCGVGNKKK